MNKTACHVVNRHILAGLRGVWFIQNMNCDGVSAKELMEMTRRQSEPNINDGSNPVLDTIKDGLKIGLGLTAIYFLLRLAWKIIVPIWYLIVIFVLAWFITVLDPKFHWF